MQDRGTESPLPYLVFYSPSVQPQCTKLLIPSLPSPEPRANRFCALALFERCDSNGDAVKRAQFPCPLKDCARGAMGFCPGRRLTRTGDSTGAQKTICREAAYSQRSTLNPERSTPNPEAGRASKTLLWTRTSYNQETADFLSPSPFTSLRVRCPPPPPH